MPLADIVILAVIALSLWKGFSRGLVREALALIGWIVGLIVAINGYAGLAPQLAPLITTPSLQQAVAFLLLCLSMVLLSYAIAQILHTLLKTLALGPADKLMGACFGAARGVLIILLAIGLFARFFQNDAWWQAATFPKALLPYVPVAQHLTDEVKQQIHHLPKKSLNPSGQTQSN
jgi:membrane protein required for colicin V production